MPPLASMSVSTCFSMFNSSLVRLELSLAAEALETTDPDPGAKLSMSDNTMSSLLVADPGREMPLLGRSSEEL